MEKTIMERYVGRTIQIRLKPDNFWLKGVVVSVHDTCFEFRTPQRISFIDYDSIATLEGF